MSPVYTYKQILLRLVLTLCAIGLALLWVILGARPALAQDNTINYSNTHLEGRDFSHADLRAGVFVAAEMRGANLSGAIINGADFTGARTGGCRGCPSLAKRR